MIKVWKELGDTMKKKELSFELMRIISVFFVIFNHTGYNGYLLFTQRESGSLQFWVDLFFSIFCLFAVPLFFAISGALMLEKEESLSAIYKRVLKFIMILLVFSAIYYINGLYLNGGNIKDINIKEFVVSLYSSQLSTHLWYLYAYIVYLICIPFLRAIAKTLESKLYIYLFVIWIAYNAILPIIEYVVSEGTIHINGEFNINWLFTRSVFYPLMGYFLHKKVDIMIFKGKLKWLLLADFAGLCVSCVMDYYKMLQTGAPTESFHASFLALNCVTLFIAIKYFCTNTRIPQKVQSLIYSCGNATFGIYLIHILVMKKAFINKLLICMREVGINYLASVFIECLVIFGISYVITAILRRIPYIKILVGN